MQRELRLGLLGLGTVNSAVARCLSERGDELEARCGRRLVIGAVAVADPAKKRSLEGLPVTSVVSADELVHDNSIELVIEAIGGADPAWRYVAGALAAGKDVVTANKAVIAAHGAALLHLAAQQNKTLRHSASVGAAVPVLETLDNALAGDRISAIEAICNGTTNFILEQMANADVDMATAIADAQRRGYAEADPSADTDGWDAAYKLVIMAAHAWGVSADPRAVRRRGIGDVTREDIVRAADLNCSIKLLARATHSGAGLALSVQPTLLVRGEHPLADVDGTQNGFLIHSDLAGATLLCGIGAGGDPTASAVINDIIATARGDAFRRGAFAQPAAVADAETTESSAYVRIATSALEPESDIANMLEDRGVPVLSVIASSDDEVIVLTGSAPVAVLERALETVESMASVDHIAACFEASGKLE